MVKAYRTYKTAYKIELTKEEMLFCWKNLSITDIKWNYSSEKMKLRTYLFVGTGVIN